MDITEVPQKRDKGKKNKTKKLKNHNTVAQQENGDNCVDEKADSEKADATPQNGAFPPTFSVSEIKNKQRRHVMFMKLKQEKRMVMDIKRIINSI